MNTNPHRILKVSKPIFLEHHQNEVYFNAKRGHINFNREIIF